MTAPMRALLLAALAALLLGSCGAAAPDTPAPAGETVVLPPPRLEGGMPLTEALARRRSIRAYGARPLTWEEISQLLWAAQGITGPQGQRTAPSAGALYPLEVYVVLPSGWYHYRPQGHSLEQVGDTDLRGALWQAGLQQDALQEAPAVFVLSGVISRSAAKYGERAERYTLLEAGHAAQNLLLQATALGLGAVPIGAFDDEAVRRALHLPASHTPLYLVPVGEP